MMSTAGWGELTALAQEVLSPEVSLLTVPAAGSSLPGWGQSGDRADMLAWEFLEDYLVWLACSPIRAPPTLPLSLVLRGSAALRTQDRESSGATRVFCGHYSKCVSPSWFSLPFALGL